MFSITKNSSNTIALTLTENATISNPYWLVEFVNDTSNNSYTCIATDSSTAKERYNLLSIVEKSNPDITNGEISLPATGSYRYKVYEQTSSTNTDVAFTGKLVEVGKCIVVGDTKTKIKADVKKTKIIFNG